MDDAPTADAGADFAIDEGGTASFSGSGFDPDGDTLAYSWDFGDGTTGSGASPTHEYLESGTYTVILTVSDGTLTDSDTLLLTVRNVAPTANVSGPNIAVPGQSVSFSFSASDSSPGDTAAGFSYQINWGDGQSETVSGPASGITRSHTYTSTGSRSVTVRATDRDDGTSSPESASIAVTTANIQDGSLFIGGTVNGDTIDIHPANSSGGIAVTVNGSSAGAFAPTGDIVVYGQAGNDAISIATTKIGKSNVSVARPVFLFGGDGNDTLNASGATAGVVVVGGFGSDTITGGLGRDLLIGGAGADNARGGDGEDILIGGTTDFDASLQILRALRAEWTRTDNSRSERIAHLRGRSGGLNQAWFLTTATVVDDAAADTLYGEGGNDWFFARRTAVIDSLPDDKKSEEFTWI